MSVICFGSLNIDYVYRVPHIVVPGESLPATGLTVFPGGKGANQAAALARAGAKVRLGGKIGHDGQWLLERLRSLGVDTSSVAMSTGPTGYAIIQIDDAGQNAIVVLAGANRQVTKLEIDNVLKSAAPGSTLLVQNETSHVPHLIKTGHERGLKVCINPAPFGEEVHNYPLNLVDLIVVNEVEAAGLARLPLSSDPRELLDKLVALYPAAAMILTLGEQGAIYQRQGERLHQPACRVEVVDTVAAGDTFIGYYLATQAERCSVAQSLAVACQAAAICVSRPGAMDSIPKREEVAGA